MSRRLVWRAPFGAVAAVTAVVACGGCGHLLGLDETTYSPHDGGTDATPDASPDACGLACAAPFASCRALAAAYPLAASGVYTLDAGTGTFHAYCDLTGDGGGWTLALKADGSMTTFAYDASIWQDATILAPGSPDLDRVEAKLETFNAVPFTEMRVGLEAPIGSNTIQWLVLPIAASRLRDLFAAPTATPTALGRDAWKSLLGTSASLQPNCNLEGIDVSTAYQHVRIGIIANNELDCATPDSRLGIGANPVGQCGVGVPETTGNASCYGGDNGDVSIAAFGWIEVR